jgi:hypothetical protein
MRCPDCGETLVVTNRDHTHLACMGEGCAWVGTYGEAECPYDEAEYTEESAVDEKPKPRMKTITYDGFSVEVDLNGPFIDVVDDLIYELGMDPEDAELRAWRLVQ